MGCGAAVESYEVAEKFERTLKRFREALAEMDLEVAAEFEGGGTEGALDARTLLVDSPLLCFEALALDRSAALYFPTHVIVSRVGDRTRISILDLARTWHARLPAGAGEPMERLAARIRMAVEAVSESGADGDGRPRE